MLRKKYAQTLIAICLVSVAGIILLTTTIGTRSFSSPHRMFRADASSAELVTDIFAVSVPQWKLDFQRSVQSAPAAGSCSAERKQLVIGLASAYRTENYLKQTLQALVEKADETEKAKAVVVIYLSDSDPERNGEQLEFIKSNFGDQLRTGFFQVILSNPKIYPPLDFAKRTHKDPANRVKWRAKQVIDFAYLFSYSQYLGDYYLVMEDDVISDSHYVDGVLGFIASKRNKQWVALQFTQFVGIGLLFRSEDLHKLVQVLWLFYQENPVDLLMRDFIRMQGETKTPQRVPSLFQHIGKRSTLEGKVQKLVDATFGQAERKFVDHRNPDAQITTSNFRVYREFFPVLPYQQAPGYFWGIPKPEEGDNKWATYRITFTQPVNVKRVYIDSGLLNKDNVTDFVEDGKVKLSGEAGAGGTCDGKFKDVAVFQNGTAEADVVFLGAKCLDIVIGPKQQTWVILKEIQIFTS